ncbi:hypothetical protein [Streptomyces sp. 4F14]|uniref:hypothetical protein n=1 Tax=Streptomyces sp. 4F14 TaxID=3394380 RepID=UPI003A86C4FB
MSNANDQAMRACRVAFITAFSVALLRLRKGRTRRREQPDTAGFSDEPSAEILLQTLLSEREQDSARQGVLNGTASALLGLEAVLGAVALDLSAAPNWKMAGLSALVASMLCSIAALADFVRQGPLTLDSAGLQAYLTTPAEETRLTLIATVSGLITSGRHDLIRPKRRSLVMSVVALIVGAILLGVGAGVKEPSHGEKKEHRIERVQGLGYQDPSRNQHRVGPLGSSPLR